MRIWMWDGYAGGLVNVDDARVSVLDHGFTVADGVFETLKVTQAGAFALTRHLRRLAGSAAVLGLPEPDSEVIRRGVAEVVDAWCADGGELGRLRITYTAGIAPLGSDRDEVTPTLVIAAADAPMWSTTTSATVAPWTRNERSPVTGAKTTSYAENVVALEYARARGFSEALLANTRGDLCEGTSTNVFAVIDGQVHTPPLHSGCLPGITRELVIGWFDVIETDLPIDVVTEVDEIFVTSSTREVHPVTRLDERSWEQPGPVASELQRVFAAEAARNIDP